MNIELREIPIKDLVDSYSQSEETGVLGYGGALDIRPPYQREFVYSADQQKAVIESIAKGFPLNVMYWSDECTDNSINYELIDGQQRTLSICDFMNNKFSVEFETGTPLMADNLRRNNPNLYQHILDYKLLVYVCKGENQEKLDWFKTINIAGERLTDQELRNAVYTGSFITEAKKLFSKTNCPVQQMFKDYLKGSAIRQDYLETTMKWFVNSTDEFANIEEYMDARRDEDNADELFNYIQEVFSWVTETFGDKRNHYRREQKGLEWGILFNKYKGNEYCRGVCITKVTELMADDEVGKKKGIYEYLLSGRARHLSLRAFTDAQRRSAYTLQEGICPTCGEHFEIGDMHADHKVPWSRGGKTDRDNLQMLCIQCNLEKSDH